MTRIRIALSAVIAALAFTLAAPAAMAETGIASWYGDLRVTASGRSYSPANPGLAAHKTLRLGTWVKVTNLRNGKSLKVRIIDRGPYIRGRIIDLTPAGARALGFYDAGLTKVTVTVLGHESLKKANKRKRSLAMKAKKKKLAKLGKKKRVASLAAKKKATVE